MEHYLAFLLFAIVSGFTPGPNNIMVMTSGLNHGISKTLPHCLGVSIGFPVMAAAVGFGLSSVFSQYPLLHQVIKIVGISYLMYLAWKIANTRNPGASEKLQKPLSFLQALAFQWVNPKAWVVIIGAVAAYTSGDNLTLQIVYIMFTFLVIGALSVGLWLFMGAALQNIIQSQRQLQIFNVIMAIILITSVIPIILSEVNPGT